MSSPLIHQPAWQKQIPFLPILSAFILGIISQKILLSNVSGSVLLLLFAILFLSAIVFHLIRDNRHFIPVLRTSSLYLAFFFLGAMVCYDEDIRHDKNWYGHQIKTEEAFQVKVTGPAEQKAKTLFVPVEVQHVLINEKWKKAVGKINLYFYSSGEIPKIVPGSHIIIPNKLRAIKSNGNPYNFDYAVYLQRHNLFHQEFINAREALFFPAPQRSKSFVPRLRTQLIKSIQENVPDTTTASLIEATLLNERTMLDNDVWKAYSLTGIAHIIAISGMHVSLLLSILLLLLSWIRHKRLEWVKYFLAIPLVWFYIVLTDFPPSAVRAAVMFTLLAIAITINRQRNSINILAATAFLLLFYDPFWLYDTGVQLSFAAVLSILIFYVPIRKWWTPQNKILTYLWEIIAVSLAAQILVFPLVIYYFHQFPLWVLVANIPAAIFSLLLMCGALLLFCLDAFSIPCLWLGKGLVFMTKSFHLLIFWLAAHTPLFMRHFYIDEPDFWLLMIAVVSFSMFCLSPYRKKMFLFAGMGTLCILICSFSIQDYFAATQKRIVVYNVSHHTAIDYFYGKTCKNIRSGAGKLNFKTTKYNLFPARLGYRAIKKLSDAGDDIWMIDHQKILHLDGNMMQKTQKQFPVTFLILSDNCSFDPGFWENVFHPAMIILDSSFPRWKAAKWERKLTAMNVMTYNVQEKGAWVFPG